MRPKYIFRIIGMLIFLSSLLPTHRANALPSMQTLQADFFQLPWEQGLAWVSLDGFDNGLKRGWGSPHNYLNGGAVDFAPRKDMVFGEDTSTFWVTAAAAGTIVQISNCHLLIDHQNGWTTEYQFLANFQVEFGEEVYRNQRLGIIADGVRDSFCPPALQPDIPHVHFSLRPTMRDATFAGWEVNYNPLFNKTTFTKNGLTVKSYEPLLNVLDLYIALRDPITWDTPYEGSIDAYRYERWPFVLTEDMTFFTLTTTPITEGLEPLVMLLDENGNELDRSMGVLTSSQPAGDYFVQIQPQAGDGFYNLFLRKNIEPIEPYTSVITPTNISEGETALVNIYLGNIPPEGYTSAEFTCTYDASIIQVDDIATTDLFGIDPAVAINGPQDGAFIFALAGSNGQRATTSGTVFTFNITGLQVGQTTIGCAGRVSTGDGFLSDIMAINADLTVSEYSPTPSPGPNPLPTSQTLTGQVLASKPVTINLYSLDNASVTSVLVNADGTFLLPAPAGTYTVVAEASGFLKAQGSAMLIAGETLTKPTISLIAGDIDGDAVIDQFDAMTIAMNYNMTSPEAADLNADGIINVLDLEILAANYRLFGTSEWE